MDSRILSDGLGAKSEKENIFAKLLIFCIYVIVEKKSDYTELSNIVVYLERKSGRVFKSTTQIQ